jgi:hypothetical protein
MSPMIILVAKTLAYVALATRASLIGMFSTHTTIPLFFPHTLWTVRGRNKRGKDRITMFLPGPFGREVIRQMQLE